MKIDWKFKMWISFIVLTAVGLVIYFSVMAINDFGKSFMIMPTNEYVANLK